MLREVTHQQGRTFSRSYGTILPSSFTRVLSSALVFSTCPPVSVCGTVLYKLWLAAFPGSRASMTSLYVETSEPCRTSELIASRIFLGHTPTTLNGHVQQTACLPFSVPPLVLTRLKWYRNINLSSIDYAFRPHLRYRLTLRGLTLLRKPWVFGDAVSRCVYRYSCQHHLF